MQRLRLRYADDFQALESFKITEVAPGFRVGRKSMVEVWPSLGGKQPPIKPRWDSENDGFVKKMVTLYSFKRGGGFKDLFACITSESLGK